MTRRDYVLLSDALREAKLAAKDSLQRVGVRIATIAISEKLSERNPTGFDTERFLNDAGF